MPMLLQNLHILTNKSQKDIFLLTKNNNSLSQKTIWIIFELEQEIFDFKHCV